MERGRVDAHVDAHVLEYDLLHGGDLFEDHYPGADVEVCDDCDRDVNQHPSGALQEQFGKSVVAGPDDSDSQFTHFNSLIIGSSSGASDF